MYYKSPAAAIRYIFVISLSSIELRDSLDPFSQPENGYLLASKLLFSGRFHRLESCFSPQALS